MKRDDRPKRGQNGNHSRGPGPQRRVNRMSEDSQQSFKQRRAQREEEGLDSFKSSTEPRKRSERPQKEDNVSLFLSDRMMELAQELAEEAGMPLKTYLAEALKYILLAHGKRLGKSDKYVTEFQSKNKRQVGTWRPESDTPEGESEEGEGERFERQERRPQNRPQGQGRYGQDRGGESGGRSGQYRARSGESGGRTGQSRARSGDSGGSGQYRARSGESGGRTGQSRARSGDSAGSGQSRGRSGESRWGQGEGRQNRTEGGFKQSRPQGRGKSFGSGKPGGKGRPGNNSRFKGKGKRPES